MNNCIKIEKNDCMEATMVFYSVDGTKKTVAFETREDRDRMFDTLKTFFDDRPIIIDFSTFTFVNEMHKLRFLSIVSDLQFGQNIELLHIEC